MSGKLSEAELAGARKKYVDAKTLPHELQAAKRIHLSKCDHMNDWWVGYGKDDSCQIEGSQNHWRWLAMLILGLADECDAPYSEQKDTPEFVEAMFAHVDALTAENERLTRERDTAIRERVEAHGLAKRLADDAIVALAGSKIATPEEGYLRAPQCLGDDIKRLRKERDAAQQRLAALAVDPTKREELVRKIYHIWNAEYYGEDEFPNWDEVDRRTKKAWKAVPEFLYSRGLLDGHRARDAEVADLQRQLSEATKRLADLTKPADEEELRKIAWANYGSVYCQQKGEFLEPYESATPERRARIDKAADAVAARVRGPLVQQIAELTEKLAAAERTAKAANDGREHAVRNQDCLAAELATIQQALAAMTDERDRARDMLRQAEASSEATQQALAAALGGLEAARKILMKISRWEMPYSKFEQCYGSNGAKDYIIGLAKTGLFPAPANPAASEPDDSSHTPETAHTSSSQSEPADHSGEADEKVQAADTNRAGTLAAFLCPKCGNDCYDSNDNRPYKMWCASDECDWEARWPDGWAEVEVAKAKKAERRFVCPICKATEHSEEFRGGVLQRLVCDGCGHYCTWAEVEAAKGKETKDNRRLGHRQIDDLRARAFCCASDVNDALALLNDRDAILVELQVMKQQLAAANQAREAAAERWQAKVLELERRCNDEHFKCEAAEQRAAAAEGREAALQSKLNDLEASRKVLKRDAEAAEAAVDALKETIKRVCFVGPADGRICSSCGSCYSPHSPQCEVGKALADPGRAADELRALREIAEKAKAVRESFDNLIRGKLVSAEALAEHSLAHTQLRAAVSDYDEAVAQGEQRGEGR